MQEKLENLVSFRCTVLQSNNCAKNSDILHRMNSFFAFFQVQLISKGFFCVIVWTKSPTTIFFKDKKKKEFIYYINMLNGHSF